MYYKVELRHFHPIIRRGDVEQDTEIIEVVLFKTKKEAKDFTLKQVKGKDYKERWATGKNDSFVYYYTGHHWQNENTGEWLEEFYSYKISKITKL